MLDHKKEMKQYPSLFLPENIVQNLLDRCTEYIEVQYHHCEECSTQKLPFTDVYQQMWLLLLTQKDFLDPLITTYAKAQPGPPQACKLKSFVAIANGFQPITTVAKFSILDVCVVPGYEFAHELETVIQGQEPLYSFFQAVN